MANTGRKVTQKVQAKHPKVTKAATTVATVSGEGVAAKAAAKKAISSKYGAASSAAKSGQKAATSSTEYRARHSASYEGKHRKSAESSPKPDRQSPEKKPGGGDSDSGEKSARNKSGLERAGSAASRRAVDSARKIGDSQKATQSAYKAASRRQTVLGLTAMRPKTRMLAAEYMAAIVMSMILLFLPDKTYHEKMSRFFIQMTGISGIFFFLAIGSSSPKVSRYAIPLGLLIDLSMLVYLFNRGGGQALNQVIGAPPKTGGTPPSTGGQPTGGPVRFISDVTQAYAVPHYGPPTEIVPGLTLSEPEAQSATGGGPIGSGGVA